VEGTLVSTDAGQIPIQEIVPGDMVLSKDVRTGEVGYKKVLSVSKRIAPVILAITLLSGAVVEATPEHPLERAGEISNLKSQISTKSQITNLNEDGCRPGAPTA
jgi:hypothetical protein